MRPAFSIPQPIRQHPNQRGLRSIGWIPASLLFFGSELESLRDYHLLVAANLKAAARDFEKRVKDEIQLLGLDQLEQEEFYSIHEDEFRDLDKDFPRTAIGSVLIVVCSRLEVALTGLCKDIEADGKVAITRPWGSLKSRGAQKASEFLAQNFGLGIASHPSWGPLRHYSKLRDCVVHADGDVELMSPKDKVTVRAAIRSLGPTKVIEDGAGELVIREELIDGLLAEGGALWRDLRTAVALNESLGPKYWP